MLAILNPEKDTAFMKDWAFVGEREDVHRFFLLLTLPHSASHSHTLEIMISTLETIPYHNLSGPDSVVRFGVGPQGIIILGP